MAGRVVRSSKFRHVFGSPYRKDDLYENVPVTRSAGDSNFCDANEKFIAVIIESGGGGAFMVLRHDQKGKNAQGGRVVGHKGPVLDLQWNPYNANMIASGSEDCTVKVWLIPDDGVDKDNGLDKPSVSLEGHGRKINQVLWHPTANNILFSSSHDTTIKIWDVSAGKEVSSISGHPDTIYTMAFNYDGSKLATTCKDKKLRIFDARTGELLKETQAHGGSKPTRCVFVGENNHLLSTGFSKTQERQYKLWDDDLTELKVENIDTSSGVLVPYFDADLNILYLAGKGDGNVRYFEVTEDAPYVHCLSEFKSPDPQRGLGFLPKRAVDVSKCEIARFYKLHSKNYVEPISMIVPRKADTFQEDIFPDTVGDVPALTAEEWLGGKTYPPLRVSLREGFESTAKVFVAPAAEVKATSYQPAPNTKKNEEEYHRLQAEVAHLKKLLDARDTTIRQLELESAKLKEEIARN